MGVRYTNGPIEYNTSISSATSALLRAGIDSVLAPCAAARAAVTGGFKYTLQSPDGLQMKVWIQDLGDHNASGSYIRITPTSEDESQTGQVAILIYDGRTYEAWANQCQFFVAPFGDPGDRSWVSFSCGIPALPANTSGTCTAGGSMPDVTQLWWTSSSGTGTFTSAANFRDSRYALGSYTLNYNGSLYVAAGNTDPLILGLVPLCSAINDDFSIASPPRVERYSNLTGLRIDALIAQAGTVYGQLWDAHLLTIPATLDSIVNLNDTDSDGNIVVTSWVAWNNTVPSDPNGGGGTVLATLFLLLPGSPFTESLSNVAY